MKTDHAPFPASFAAAADAVRLAVVGACALLFLVVLLPASRTVEPAQAEAPAAFAATPFAATPTPFSASPAVGPALSLGDALTAGPVLAMGPVLVIEPLFALADAASGVETPDLAPTAEKEETAHGLDVALRRCAFVFLRDEDVLRLRPRSGEVFAGAGYAPPLRPPSI